MTGGAVGLVRRAPRLGLLGGIGAGGALLRSTSFDQHHATRENNHRYQSCSGLHNDLLSKGSRRVGYNRSVL